MIIKSIFRFILPVMVIFAFLMVLNKTAIAQDKKDQGTPEIETIEIEKTIQLLENPEESKKMANQLRDFLKARKQVIEEKKEEETQKKTPTNLIKIYESYKVHILPGIEKFFSKIKTLPLTYQEFKDYLSKKEVWQQFLSFCITLFIAFLAGFIVWFGFYMSSKKLQERLGHKGHSTLSKKIGSAFINISFRIYPWIALYIFSYILLKIFPMKARIESIILEGLPALIIYYALKNLFYFLFSPDTKEKRVIPIADELSNYIFIWCRRLLLFSVWMYIFIITSSILDKYALMAVFSGIYKIGLVVMTATILAQWKLSIEKTFCISLKEEDPYWINNLKKILNYIIGKMYLLVTLYLGLAVTFSLLGFSRIYTYLIYSLLKSVIIMIFASVLWKLWEFVFKRLFFVSNNVKEKYPQMEEQVNRYINYIGRTGYSVVFIITTLAILDAWGINIYEFIIRNIFLVKALVRIPLIIITAVILIQMLYFIISNLEKHVATKMLQDDKAIPVEIEKRVSTLGRIFRKTVLITVITITAMMVFAELGFDIKPILAGAGIVGLAVGFGSQNLVRDIISGLFLIFENRIRVGDVAVINGTGGLVEQVNLRTTVLRDLNAVVHVFPNGAINTLSNMTQEFSYYVFNVGVAYKEDTDKVVEVLKGIGEEIMKDEEYSSLILEPLEVLGVDQFADSAVIIKARIKTLPIKQWFVGREINRRIKKRFDEVGIEIPFPHRTFYFGEESKSISLKMEGLKKYRKELKELIKDILKELGVK
ncbi:MAG: mechanosensitive ion channel [Thermodesulfobacteriota bacterium]|nr:mechanosensitive ion channel [Thermodesulfobacteriota bacterium]